MKYTTLLVALTALSLSACGKKEEAAAPAPAPEAAAPAAPAPAAPAPTAPEAAAPMAAMTPAAGTADVAAGETKFKTVCASCHGANAQGQGTFPKLAGLTEDTIKSKLGQYRKGETVGPMTATMAPMAKALSDADVANVAAYIATLK
jgi:cytochrome c553